MNDAPWWDARRGRLRLSPRQLGALADLVRDGQADVGDPAARELIVAGLLTDGGVLPAGLRAVAAAAADARGQVAVTRLMRRGAVRVGVTWGESGVLVMRAAGADELGDVILQPSTCLARSLWRVLQLGPRPSTPDRATVEVAAAALLAPFARGSARWTRTLRIDAGAMVLNRLDVVADTKRPPATWALLDAGRRGLWKVTSPSLDSPFTISPTSPAATYAEIGALQPVPEGVG